MSIVVGDAHSNGTFTFNMNSINSDDVLVSYVLTTDRGYLTPDGEGPLVFTAYTATQLQALLTAVQGVFETAVGGTGYSWGGGQTWTDSVNLP